MAGELSIEQRVALLESRVNRLEASLAGPVAGARPERLVMSWPVGDITRRKLEPWWSAVNYGEKYRAGEYHTGYDLNLSGYQDSGAPVYAAADGILRFAGRIDAAWLSAVVIEHALEDGRLFWTRYAHINPLPALVVGSRIPRGTQIGNIADYGIEGPVGDHLHFDAAWIDLGARPGDWPGTNRQRVLADYIDILQMIAERLP